MGDRRKTRPLEAVLADIEEAGCRSSSSSCADGERPSDRALDVRAHTEVRPVSSLREAEMVPWGHVVARDTKWAATQRTTMPPPPKVLFAGPPSQPLAKTSVLPRYTAMAIRSRDVPRSVIRTTTRRFEPSYTGSSGSVTSAKAPCATKLATPLPGPVAIDSILRPRTWYVDPPETKSTFT